jgi:hypothetical protein
VNGEASGRDVGRLGRAVRVESRDAGLVAKHAPLTASATDDPSDWEDVADLLDSLSFALTQLEASFAGDHDLKKIGLARFGKASTPGRACSR